MKKIVAVTIVSAFLVFLSLYTVNAVIMGQQKSKLREISQTLLQYSEGLSQSVAQTLKGLTTQGCDKASLDRYRQIKLDSLYFADIGFIEQGKIICTAFWGKLANPVPLPAELHKTPRGFLLAQFSRKDFFTGNAAIYNNLIIFSSRYAYDKFTPVTNNYSLSATTKDFARIFFSATHEVKEQDGVHSTLFTLTLTQCSASWDLCVIVKHHHAGLASLSPAVFAFLVAILCFIWIAITLFFFRLNEDRFSLERTLVKAVLTNTIGVHYQPIIRIQDSKIVGVEVLSRWRDAKHGDVSPELFIPLIQKIGLYKKYYTHILEKALKDIAPLRLLYRLSLRPLLLLLLLLLNLSLALTLQLQRLLTLRWRLFIPRHFVQLRRLLAHIGLHLCQQLALLVRQLIGILHFATGRGLGRRTHARLAAFQLFDIAPALFRFRRKAITGHFTGLKRLGLFLFMVRDEVQTTNKGDDNSRSNSDHCWRDSRQARLLFP